jgi:hypothetical protein
MTVSIAKGSFHHPTSNQPDKTFGNRYMRVGNRIEILSLYHRGHRGMSGIATPL